MTICRGRQNRLEQASLDLLRDMLKVFAACGAACGVHSAERVNQRNGYRPRNGERLHARNHR